jgi:hypothetical protein
LKSLILGFENIEANKAQSGKLEPIKNCSFNFMEGNEINKNSHVQKARVIHN